jgi:CheY-like chemotaxis protein
MDYRMPLMDGIETMNEIKELNSAVKVIFVSADNSIQERAIANGAVEFLKKPVDITKFQKAILNTIKKITSDK